MIDAEFWRTRLRWRVAAVVAVLAVAWAMWRNLRVSISDEFERGTVVFIEELPDSVDPLRADPDGLRVRMGSPRYVNRAGDMRAVARAWWLGESWVVCDPTGTGHLGDAWPGVAETAGRVDLSMLWVVEVGGSDVEPRILDGGLFHPCRVLARGGEAGARAALTSAGLVP